MSGFFSFLIAKLLLTNPDNFGIMYVKLVVLLSLFIGDKLYQIIGIALCNLKFGGNMAKKKSKKDKKPEPQKRKLALIVKPFGKVNGNLYSVHGNDYVFHIGTELQSIPSFQVKTSVPMIFFDGQGKELNGGNEGKFTVVGSKFIFRVRMELALRGEISFEAEGIEPIEWMLEFQ